MRLTPCPSVGSPLAGHNLKSGKPLYAASLEWAHIAHARRCKIGASPIDHKIADIHADISRKLGALCVQL